MARRRVNVKFLIILTAAVGTLVVAAVLTQRIFLRDDDPKPHLDRAAAQMAAGEYEGALRDYARAVNARQSDPELWVILGDAYFKLAGLDRDNVRQAVGRWNRALEIDPSYKPALTRMLRIFQYDLDRAAGQKELAATVERAQELANKLAQSDPEDPAAAAAPHVVTVRAWMLGIPTAAPKVEQAIAGLAGIAEEHPSEVSASYVAAGALLRRAQQAEREGRAAEAEADRTKAEQLMTALVGAQPDSAEAQFRAGQFMMALAGASPAGPAPAPGDAAPAATQPGGPRLELFARGEQHFRRAAELVKPEDELYVSVHLMTASLAQARGDREGAEKILLALVDRSPDDFDLDARVALAAQLRQDPAQRAEAIKLLEADPNLDAAEGERGMAARGVLMSALLTLVDLRLEQYATLTDAERREKTAEQIEDGIKQFAGMLDQQQDNPLVLKLRGEQQRVVQRDDVAAIQTLTRAKALMEQAGTTRDVHYLETLELLARANAARNQTGEAEKLLEKVLAQAPGHIPSLMLRARLLLSARQFEDAEAHVARLEKIVPTLPDVVRLRLTLLLARGQQKEAAELYAKLPEGDASQRGAKAQAALALSNKAEAVRLLEATLAETPGDANVSVDLARLVAADDKPRAVQLIDAAMKANPGRTDLQLFQKQMSGASPEELRELQGEIVAGIEDPFTRTVAQAQVARNEGNLDEALKQLKEAERQKPEDAGLMNALLELHAARGQWDEARGYVEKLAKANPRESSWYRFRLAMGQGKYDEALGHAQSFNLAMPEFYQSSLALAQAQQATGRLDEAVRNYRQALDKQTNNADALRGMIESLLGLGRVDEARKYMVDATAAHPQDPVFREMAVNFELQHGDADRAVAAREAAAKAQADNAQVQLTLARAYLVAAQRKQSSGQAQAAQALLAQGTAALEQGVAKFPDQLGFYELLSQAALYAKRPEVAENALKQLAAREAWKDRTEPAVLLADFYARAGRGADAEAALRDAVAKRPQDAGLQVALAGLLRGQGKIDEAAKVLDAANTSNPAVVRERIETELAAGRLDEAGRRLDAAIQAEPNSADLVATSGFLHHARRQWDEAEKQLRRALSLDPNSVFAHQYLGRVMLERPTPNLPEAIRLLSRARELAPGNVDALYALGVAYQRSRQSEDAVREFEAALDRQPTNKGVRLALTDLYVRSFTPPRWTEAARTLEGGREIQGFANDPDLLRAEAMMWAQRKDLSKALERIRAAVAAAPNAPMLVADHLALLVDAKDFAGAVREADRYLAAAKDADDPQLWWAYQFRGIAKARGGDKEGAMKDLEVALARAGAAGNERGAEQVINAIADSVGVEAALARALARADNDPQWLVVAARLQARTSIDDAIATTEKARALKDRLTPASQVQVLQTAAELYLARGDFQKAHDSYTDLIKLRPDDVSALNNLACLLVDSIDPAKPKEALKYSAQAFQLMQAAGREDAYLLDTHGWVTTLNGQLKDGINLLNRAVTAASAADQPLPEAHYHLAEAHLRAGTDPEVAKRQLALALGALEKRLQADLNPAQTAAGQALREKIQDADRQAQERIRDRKTANAQ